MRLKLKYSKPCLTLICYSISVTWSKEPGAWPLDEKKQDVKLTFEHYTFAIGRTEKCCLIKMTL